MKAMVNEHTRVSKSLFSAYSTKYVKMDGYYTYAQKRSPAYSFFSFEAKDTLLDLVVYQLKGLQMCNIEQKKMNVKGCL